MGAVHRQPGAAKGVSVAVAVATPQGPSAGPAVLVPGQLLPLEQLSGLSRAYLMELILAVSL